jgi:thiol-disulfide isomerase/thioredoxin
VLPVGREGRLQTNDLRLRGVLSAADAGALNASPPPVGGIRASCLAWHAWGARGPAVLAASADARIVYREPTPRATSPQPAAPRRVNNRGGVFDRLLNAFSNPPRLEKSDRSLHLRTGDTIVCEVRTIDENGVTFTSEMTDTTFVPHELIQAVELADMVQSVELDEAKRTRLLTLPRMQRNDPPTHLIISTSGDHLRARLLAMDEDTVTVEVRLDVRVLPRKHVARIIWLRPETEAAAIATDPQPAAGPGAAAPQPASLPAIRLQAVRSDGKRLTFLASEFREQTIAGNSDILGPCRVAVDQVDLLHLGADVEAAAAELAFQQWRLEHAVEPKFVTADGEAKRVVGTESSFVGKPAPDFTLELLSGKSFQVSQQRGTIIVLDFWASWCGPCIRAMPIVEGVVEEFAEDGVRLIAVNLQEDPETIRSALERMQLTPEVALDIDGVAAARYSATAIPQTVIIDRKGVVARLFVGGGSDFGDQLREALRAVMDEDVAP